MKWSDSRPKYSFNYKCGQQTSYFCWHTAINHASLGQYIFITQNVICCWASWISFRPSRFINLWYKWQYGQKLKLVIEEIAFHDWITFPWNKRNPRRHTLLRLMTSHKQHRSTSVYGSTHIGKCCTVKTQEENGSIEQVKCHSGKRSMRKRLDSRTVTCRCQKSRQLRAWCQGYQQKWQVWPHLGYIYNRLAPPTRWKLGRKFTSPVPSNKKFYCYSKSKHLLNMGLTV